MVSNARDCTIFGDFTYFIARNMVSNVRELHVFRESYLAIVINTAPKARKGHDSSRILPIYGNKYSFEGTQLARFLRDLTHLWQQI